MYQYWQNVRPMKNIQNSYHFRRHFRKCGLYLLYFLSVVALVSCASKAEEEPIIPESRSAGLGGNEELEALETKAKGAIARAESAGAAELSPELLEQAYLDLRNGQEMDPQADGAVQRSQYLAAIEKANQAYDESVEKSRARWLLTIDYYEADLDELNAPLYMPEYDARSREQLQELRTKIAEGDNEGSLALYQSTIPNVDAVVLALTENLDWLDQLRQEVTGLMGEASRQYLRGESADLERQGRLIYESAMGHRARGDMESMEQDLFDARYYLHEALRRSGALDPERIDALLYRVQQSLETASERQVIGPDGNEIAAEPWDGGSYLEENPLQEISRREGPRRRDESQLQRPQVSQDFLQDFLRAEPGDSENHEEDTSTEEAVSLRQPASSQILVSPAEVGEKIFAATWQLRLYMQETAPPLEEGRESQGLGDSQANDQEYEETREPATEVYSQEGNPFAQDAMADEEIQGADGADERVPQDENRVLTNEEVGNEGTGSAGPETEAQEYIADDGSQIGQNDLLTDAQLLLKQAISSWKSGVKARNRGDLPLAQHYLEESARLVNQYNVQYAILGYYTVRRLKPEDCLWRIAGYTDIYGDPYQWTRIYQRNRDQISNPSLIYPGQRLIIPPSKDERLQ